MLDRLSRRGFTLIELVVVVAIVATLIALLLPAVQSVRAAAARLRCANNLKQMVLACHAFESTHGVFPSSVLNTGPQRGWPVQMLPWIERGDVARRYDFTRMWVDPVNADAVASQVATFYCPASPYGPRLAVGEVTVKINGQKYGYEISGAACTDYAVLDEVKEDAFVAGFVDARGWGVLREDQFARVLDITDGTSHTLMIVECAGRPDWWVRGRMVAADEKRASAPWASRSNDIGFDGFDLLNPAADAGPCAVNCSNSSEVYAFHPRGANAALADGSVRFLSDQTPTRLFGRLVTRSGGEVVEWSND